jgi:hypothetical protein
VDGSVVVLDFHTRLTEISQRDLQDVVEVAILEILTGQLEEED